MELKIDIFPVDKEFQNYDIILDKISLGQIGYKLIKQGNNDNNKFGYNINDDEDSLIEIYTIISQYWGNNHDMFHEKDNDKLQKLIDISQRTSYIMANENLKPGIDTEIDIESLDCEEDIKALYREYKDILPKNRFDLGTIKGYKFKIELKDPNATWYVPMKKCSYKHLQVYKEQIPIYLKKGIIRKVEGGTKYLCPSAIITMPSGEDRMIMHYQYMNKFVKDIPCKIYTAIEIMLATRNYDRMSCGDFRQGYQQGEVDGPSQIYLPFDTPLGIFTWNKIPLGIKTAPAFYQSMMMDIFKDQPDFYPYIDNIYIRHKSSNGRAYNLKMVRTFFDILRKHNIKLNIAKSSFIQKEIEILGYMRGENNIYYIKEDYRKRCLAIKRPENRHEVMQFSGLVQFIAQFIPDLQLHMRPIHQLKSKKVKFEWTQEREKAFQYIKYLIENSDYLKIPLTDLPFILLVDASKYGIGAVLLQYQNNKLEAIAFWSKLLTQQQIPWTTNRKELYAMIISLERFRDYIINTITTVLTDHKNLLYIMNKKYPSAIESRWLARLSEFNIRIGHIKSLENKIADYLSRKAYRMKSNVIDKLKSNIYQIELLKPNCQECERQMVHTKIDTLYLDDAICDNCNKVIPFKEGNNYIWHCFNTIHTEGYDLCKECSLMIIQEQESLKGKSKRITRSRVRGRKPVKYQPELKDETLETENELFKPEEKVEESKSRERVKESKPRERVEESKEKSEELKSVGTDQDRVRLADDSDVVSLPGATKDLNEEITDEEYLSNYYKPITLKEIEEAQSQDPDCIVILNYLKDKNKFNYLLGDISSQLADKLTNNEFSIKDNIIMIDYQNSLKIFMPSKLRIRLITNIHDKISHHGENKLLNELRANYYWIGYVKDVREFLSKCLTCAKNKAARKHKTDIIPIIVNKINDLVSLDIEGPILKSQDFMRYILTIQDHFSKYSKFIPCRNIRADTIVKLILDNWIYIFGTPNTLLSDRGTQFTSKLYKLVTKILGINVKLTPPFRPQENGGNERLHRYILNKLRNIISEDLDFNQWSEFISKIEWNYNTTINRAIGYTPFEVMFNRKPIKLSNILTNPLIEDIEKESPSIKEKLSKGQLQKEEINKNIQSHRIGYSQSMKQQNKTSTSIPSIKINDQILVKHHSRKFKQEPNYLGPFIVTRILGNNVYYKDNYGHKRISHLNDVKLFNWKEQINLQD